MPFMNTEHDDDDRDPPPGEDRPEDLTVIEAHELFAGKREIWIDHAGVRYRLRITRRNKLILQK
jgi:hemin uptake protein HemP